MTDPSQNPKPPTRIAKEFVRYIVGFGVAFAIGVAPFLGNYDVPLFKPLLSLIPITIQDTVIPLSAFLMGVVAVFVEWYGRERVTKVWLRKMFLRSLAVTLAAVLLFVVVHTLNVVRIPVDGGTDAISFVVGFERPIRDPCGPLISDAECIKRLTFDPSLISSFWGDSAIRISTLVIVLAYLMCTSMFGVMVGIVLLRNLSSEQKSE